MANCCENSPCDRILTLHELDTLLSGHSVTSGTSSSSPRIYLNKRTSESNWWGNNSGRTVSYNEIKNGIYSDGNVGMGYINSSSSVVELPFINLSSGGVSGIYVESSYTTSDGDTKYYSGNTDNACCSGETGFIREDDMIIRSVSGNSTDGGLTISSSGCKGTFMATLTLPTLAYDQTDYDVCPPSSSTIHEATSGTVKSIVWTGAEYTSSGTTTGGYYFTGSSTNFGDGYYSDGFYEYYVKSGDTVGLTITVEIGGEEKTYITSNQFYEESYITTGWQNSLSSIVVNQEQMTIDLTNYIGNYPGIDFYLTDVDPYDAAYIDQNSGNLKIWKKLNQNFNLCAKTYCNYKIDCVNITVSIESSGDINHDSCCDGGGSASVGKKFTGCQ